MESLCKIVDAGNLFFLFFSLDVGFERCDNLEKR